MNLQIDRIGYVLFLDIETVSQYPTYEELDERGQELWQSKMKYHLNEETSPSDLYLNRGAILAEFGKIICISVGIVFGEDRDKVKMTTFHGEEIDILTKFKTLVEEHFNDSRYHQFCGHNIKEFDIPYICRRMISNGIEIPSNLFIAGKKPWQVPHMIDTLELWKFGDYKNYTSLDLIAYTLGIDTPKSHIDGSKVGEVYYDKDQDNGIIYEYCERDVLAVIQVVLKLANRPLLEIENVIFSAIQ